MKKVIVLSIIAILLMYFGFWFKSFFGDEWFVNPTVITVIILIAFHVMLIMSRLRQVWLYWKQGNDS